MDVWIVTDRDGFVWGVYTTERRAMARYGEVSKDVATVLKPQRKLLNTAAEKEEEDGTQESSGSESNGKERPTQAGPQN